VPNSRAPKANSAPASRAPGPEPDQRAFVRVSADAGLNLRQAADKNGAVIAVLPKDTLLYLRDGDALVHAEWCAVCTPDGIAGFVWGEYLATAEIVEFQ
jgi:hypothetical protein